MIKRHLSLLLLTFLLMISFGCVTSIFILKYKQYHGVKENRVKRAWRSYSERISIKETIRGTNFSPKAICEVSSTNPNTMKYTLLGARQKFFYLRHLAETAMIWQRKGIDREIFSNMVIYVRALDANDQPSESVIAKIDIDIVDENDNAPIFDETSLTASVFDSTAVEKSFMKLSATDADSSYSDYNKIRYTYIGNENPPKADGLNRFAVSESGQVSILSSLNLDTDITVTFLVRAMDGLPNADVFRHSTTGTVTVNVLDKNENTPYFTKNVYRKSIAELSSVGSTIAIVQADDDDDDGVNKGVYFKISSGNIDDRFSIQSYPNFKTGTSFGNIILEATLDFESGQQSYDLEIVAYNKDANNNAESLTSATSVQLTVIDENEPPVFLSESFYGFVMENQKDSVNDIVKVTARDFDFGGTQNVSYALEDPLGWFVINEVDGKISTLTSVDREHAAVNNDTSLYLFTVTARDDGEPNLTSTATVVITVGDENDNAPKQGNGWNPRICERPSLSVRRNTTILNVKDEDSNLFAPFTLTKLNSKDWNFFDLKESFESNYARLVIPNESVFEKKVYNLPIRLVDAVLANQQFALTSTQTVSVSICRCNEFDIKDEFMCSDDVNITLIVVLPLLTLVVLILIPAVVACKRRSRQKIKLKKQANKKDDVRETLQAYQKEGEGVAGDNSSESNALLQDPMITTRKQQNIIPSITNADLQPNRSVILIDFEHNINDEEDDSPKQSEFKTQQMSLVCSDYKEKESKTPSKPINKKTGPFTHTNIETPSGKLNYDASSFKTSVNEADIVGVGGYGVVRKCVHPDLGNVVVKCMYCGGNVDFDSKVAEAHKRVLVFTRFDHEFIVRFHGMTCWDNCFGMIMEEVQCGNLRDLLIRNKTITTIYWKLRFRIIFQLANALKYLHCHDPKKCYVHLDIKPENILLTLNLNIKLADFGALDMAIATGADPTQTTDLSSAYQYTLWYTAPERLRDIFAKVSSSVDVYSFAMICYEVITRQQVFSDFKGNPNLVQELVATKGQTPNMKLISTVEQELKQNISNDFMIFEKLEAVMVKCWCFQPKDRPSIKEINDTLTEFAESLDLNDVELRNHVIDLANVMSAQKLCETSKNQVPLKLHCHPFQNASVPDVTSSSSVRFSSQTDEVFYSDQSLDPSNTTVLESISLSN